MPEEFGPRYTSYAEVFQEELNTLKQLIMDRKTGSIFGQVSCAIQNKYNDVLTLEKLVKDLPKFVLSQVDEGVGLARSDKLAEYMSTKKDVQATLALVQKQLRVLQEIQNLARDLPKGQIQPDEKAFARFVRGVNTIFMGYERGVPIAKPDVIFKTEIRTPPVSQVGQNKQTPAHGMERQPTLIRKIPLLPTSHGKTPPPETTVILEPHPYRGLTPAPVVQSPPIRAQLMPVKLSPPNTKGGTILSMNGIGVLDPWAQNPDFSLRQELKQVWIAVKGRQTPVQKPITTIAFNPVVSTQACRPGYVEPQLTGMVSFYVGTFLVTKTAGMVTSDSKTLRTVGELSPLMVAPVVYYLCAAMASPLGFTTVIEHTGLLASHGIRTVAVTGATCISQVTIRSGQLALPIIVETWPLIATVGIGFLVWKISESIPITYAQSTDDVYQLMRCRKMSIAQGLRYLDPEGQQAFYVLPPDINLKPLYADLLGDSVCLIFDEGKGPRLLRTDLPFRIPASVRLETNLPFVTSKEAFVLMNTN